MMRRIPALTLAAVISLNVGTASTARASRAGRRNTAIALGALSVYGIARRKPVLAAAAGAGALYSYARSRRGHRHHFRRRHRR